MNLSGNELDDNKINKIWGKDFIFSLHMLTVLKLRGCRFHDAPDLKRLENIKMIDLRGYKNKKVSKIICSLNTLKNSNNEKIIVKLGVIPETLMKKVKQDNLIIE